MPKGVYKRQNPRNPSPDFWSLVDKSKGRNKCWPWLGVIEKDGYGRFRPIVGKPETTAHRVAYMLKLNIAHLPRTIFVLHECDNRRCCNPRHLFLGTNQDNMDDMVKKNRQPHVKLTDEKVRLAKKLFISGRMSIWKIAQMMKVNHWTIYNAVFGITWKHIK